MSSKMEFTRYLESFPIAKGHSSTVASTLQEVSLLLRSKNEIAFSSQPVFLFDKCPTTTSHFSSATANLSNSFSSSNQALRNSPSIGSVLSYNHDNLLYGN